MSKNLKKEFEDLLKLGENAGIEDLIMVYGHYEEIFNQSKEYLDEFDPKYISTTSDST